MNRWMYECCRRFAMLLARVELHSIVMTERDGSTLVRKRRSRFAKLLVPLGNIYLWFIGSCSYVLSESEWHQWESTVGDATIESQSVVTPRHRGETLDQILQSASVTTEDKLRAMDLAIQSLLSLQLRKVSFGAVQSWLLSHGDATVENVCVDLVNGSAKWFDFDMRHEIRISADKRHADDLRALLFSAACHLQTDSYSELVEIYIDRLAPKLLNVVEEEYVAWRRPTIFQLAQAPLSFRNHLILNEVLATERSSTEPLEPE